MLLQKQKVFLHTIIKYIYPRTFLAPYMPMGKMSGKYSETLNNEYIGRIYQMSDWQFFNELYTILRKFQYLQK